LVRRVAIQRLETPENSAMISREATADRASTCGIGLNEVKRAIDSERGKCNGT